MDFTYYTVKTSQVNYHINSLCGVIAQLTNSAVFGFFCFLCVPPKLYGPSLMN